ncbi:hypothetical protein MTBBW1_50011 [Desulfamplus magnetovallimortis]|uniref:Uncharacterized protein n=1 Tax=Desulfamplus magnetovallimortis TaxID=1246637 RepID=A0A1W1HHN5_9BACT|nr:hypothetical protein MTBBW1_50011 [Desulfamplus magnetovallimortis]
MYFIVCKHNILCANLGTPNIYKTKHESLLKIICYRDFPVEPRRIKK